MKKKILIFLMGLLLSSYILKIDVVAITYDDSGNAGFEVTSTTDEDLNGGVFYTNAWGNTIKSGIRYSQQVNVLTLKTDETAKAVTWAIKDASKAGFIRQTVANIAQDYENKHPGWTVMGAINADQYYTKYGEALGVDGSDYFYPQPYYPMIADGEKWFALTATPYGNGYIVGFKNDGSVDPLVYQNTGLGYTGANKATIAGLYLTIINEEGPNESFIVDRFNQEPGTNETSLMTPYYTGATMPSLNVSGSNIFVVGNADLAYVSNSETYTYKIPHNQNAFFGKGSISSITQNVTLSKGQFAIQTTNADVLAALNVGDYIKVQYEFEGALADVESGIGFHTIMRDNDIDKTSSATYNTSLYPRSIFGRKADGTMVYLTIDGRQADAGMVGVNMQESNAILKHYGVVEAYQMDGGGSVTMVIRDGDRFTTVNSPSDGSDRSVLSALLFVVKKIDHQLQFEAIETNRIVFDIDLLDEHIDQLYVKLNDEIKEVIDGQVVFEELLPNTRYKYEFLTYKDDVLTYSVVSGYVNTAKRMPSIERISMVKSGNDYVFDIIIIDPDSAIVRKNLHIGSQTEVIPKRQVILTSLDALDFNNLTVSLNYDLNDGQGRQEIIINEIVIRSDLVMYMNHVITNIREEVRKIYE